MSKVTADNSQNQALAKAGDPNEERREAMTSENKYGGIKFRRTLNEVVDTSDELTLDIDKRLLHPDLEYRWELEKYIPLRERAGWEVVPEGHFEKNAGVSLTRPSSSTSKEMFRLMATPKSYFQARQDKREQFLQQQEGAIVEGVSDGKGGDMKDMILDPKHPNKIQSSLVKK